MLGSGQTCRTLDIRAGRPVLGLQGRPVPPHPGSRSPSAGTATTAGLTKNTVASTDPCLWHLTIWPGDGKWGAENQSPNGRCSGRSEGVHAETLLPPTRAHTGDLEALGSLSFWWRRGGGETQSEICKAAHLRLELHGVAAPSRMAVMWPCPIAQAPRPQSCQHPISNRSPGPGGLPLHHSLAILLSQILTGRTSQWPRSPAPRVPVGFLQGRGSSLPTHRT